jgi:hypothetical protein
LLIIEFPFLILLVISYYVGQCHYFWNIIMV